MLFYDSYKFVIDRNNLSTVVHKNYSWNLRFYPRPFWPTGFVIACVSVCVCQLLLVRVKTHHAFQLEAPDLDEKMQNILLKVPIVFGGWLGLTFHIKFNFISKFCLFASFLRLWNICETCKNGVCWAIPHRTWPHIHSDSLYARRQGRAMDRETV